MKTVHPGPGLSRRHALACLTAAPATALAAPMAPDRPALPVATTTNTQTPVMAVFARYVAYRDWLNAFPVNTPDSEMDPRYAGLLEIEAEMMALPTLTATDLAAKAIVDGGFGDFANAWATSPFWREARKLTGLKDPETAASPLDASAGEPPEE